MDVEALRQWSLKVDDDLEGIQNTLLKQNTVLNSLQQALFATDDTGTHNQIGLMTTEKIVRVRRCCEVGRHNDNRCCSGDCCNQSVFVAVRSHTTPIAPQ
jgi:hypothetical protein